MSGKFLLQTEMHHQIIEHLKICISSRCIASIASELILKARARLKFYNPCWDSRTANLSNSFNILKSILFLLLQDSCPLRLGPR